ncbi:MAG: hypothetical protein K2X86_09900 [Cytophagaceae bacterium]|nr:hypothetical protein [Cytophagaceae bacterium]
MLFLFFLALLISCDSETGKTKKDADSTEAKSNKKGPVFRGTPDLPDQQNQITSGGIGKIKLGDSLNSVHAFYDSIKELTVYVHDYEWPAKKILLGKNKWIIAESVHSVNQITSIRTNDPGFFTSSGYHPGMKIDSILLNKDSIIIDNSERALFIYNKGILFKLDPKSEKKFFKEKNPDIRNYREATIGELFIICGDC